MAARWANRTAVSTTSPTAVPMDVSTAGCLASSSAATAKDASAEPPTALPLAQRRAAVVHIACRQSACAAPCAYHGLCIDERQPRRQALTRDVRSLEHDTAFQLQSRCFVEQPTVAKIENEAQQRTAFLSYSSGDGGSMAWPTAADRSLGLVADWWRSGRCRRRRCCCGQLRHRDHR
jgi:hypothetical protein